jgi:hypothetical protein
MIIDAVRVLSLHHCIVVFQGSGLLTPHLAPHSKSGWAVTAAMSFREASRQTVIR